MPTDDQSSAPKTFPEEMSDKNPCGRPIYHPPPGMDERPVCLMHSDDPNKDKELFRKEIDAILNDTSRHHCPTDKFDFESFVFPKAKFDDVEFTRTVNFSWATFTQGAVFRKARFTGGAYFGGAKFTKGANFSWATFTKGTHFMGATFSVGADFIEATFTKAADFLGAKFTEGANFRGATFAGLAAFRQTRFEQPTRVHFFQINKNTSEGFRARFLNCRVEELHFEDVNWYKKGPRMVLQDELDILSGESKEHELVAVAYRQLINNFERTRAYHLSEDCSIGAMEMRRRNPEHFLFGRYATLRNTMKGIVGRGAWVKRFQL